MTETGPPAAAGAARRRPAPGGGATGAPVLWILLFGLLIPAFSQGGWDALSGTVLWLTGLSAVAVALAAWLTRRVGGGVPLAAVIMTWLAAAGLAALSGADREAARAAWLTVAAGASLYALCSAWADGQAVGDLAAAWALAGAAVAAVAIFQAISGHEPVATLVNPNVLAHWLLFPAGFVWMFLREDKRPAWKICAVLIAGGLAVTRSWSVMGALVAACVWQSGRTPLAIGLWGAGAAGAVLALPRSLADRFVWWDAAVRIFAGHPWLGVGPGGFGGAYLAYKTVPGRNSLFAHSAPIEILSETGLTGFLAWGLFVGLMLLAAWRARDSVSPYRRAAAISLVASTLAGLTDASLSCPAVVVSWWIAAAILLRREVPLESRPPLPAPVRRGLAWVAGVSVAVLGWGLVQPLRAAVARALAESHMASGAVEPARAAARLAVRLDPQSWRARAVLAETDVAAGMTLAALRDLDEAGARSVYQAEIPWRQAVLWNTLGDREQELAALRRAIARHRHRADFHAAMSRIHAARGEAARP